MSNGERHRIMPEVKWTEYVQYATGQVRNLDDGMYASVVVEKSPTATETWIRI